VCEHLDMPLYEADFVAQYWQRVFQPFLDKCASPSAAFHSALQAMPELCCQQTILHALFIATLHHAPRWGAGGCLRLRTVRKHEQPDEIQMNSPTKSKSKSK